MQPKPINPEYALELLFRDQNVSKSIALLLLTHLPLGWAMPHSLNAGFSCFFDLSLQIAIQKLS
jgi:hypothetical protein